ncbi:MAG: NADH-quinone oxidoreductase subunit M, partial [Gammaproteobacteria bacterium]|nr:NADH-quinone oxidoreductase subunit M [Gammaproteobacteria bacterium]
MELNWLSIVTWTPIIGGLWVLAAGSRSAPVAKSIALIVSLLTFLFSIPLYTGFDITTADMQFTERVAWIPAFH